jgi:hypothetical protein
MARPDKAATVAEISDKFRTSSAAVLTEYRGLTVSQLTQLRKNISAHATYAVVKNTLTAVAARDAGVTALDESALAGPTAIAFVSGDPVEDGEGPAGLRQDQPGARHQGRRARRSPAVGGRGAPAGGPRVARGACWPSWPAR